MIKKLSSQCSDLLNGNRCPDEDNDDLHTKIKQLQAQADNDRNAKITTQMLLNQTEMQLRRSHKRNEQL
jgi:hypothetical protein